MVTTVSGISGFRWLSLTTHTSISLLTKSASSATTARTRFFVFAKLHILMNINLGTAKPDSLEGTFLVDVELMGTKLLRLLELIFEILLLQCW